VVGTAAADRPAGLDWYSLAFGVMTFGEAGGSWARWSRRQHPKSPQATIVLVAVPDAERVRDLIAW